MLNIICDTAAWPRATTYVMARNAGPYGPRLLFSSTAPLLGHTTLEAHQGGLLALHNALEGRAGMVKDPTILLVGHDAVNTAMIEFACGTLPAHPQCQNAYGVTEALSLIQNVKNPQINLIVIDLDTVEDGGLTLLEALKENSASRTIPVLMTAKGDPKDLVQKAYDLGCSGFVVKPGGLKAWTHTMEVITDYWFTHCQSPKCPY